MKPGRLLLLLCLCFANAALAQNEIFWLPDTAVHLVGPVPFDRVTVADVRINTSAIGWLKKGALNRFVDLKTEESLSATLTTYSRRLLRTAAAQPGELLLVIRDFSIEDRKGKEEIGTVHLQVDAFARQGSAEVYRYLAAIDTLHEIKGVWDVTAAVQRLASQSILYLLEDVSRRFILSDETELYSYQDAVSREEKQKAAWPLYDTAAPPRGIYNTYEDFLQLRPSPTPFLDKRILAGELPPATYFHYLNEKGRKGKEIKPEDCYAIYDGKRWHISLKNGFREMKRQGNDYYTTLNLTGITDRSGEVIMAGASAGVIGIVLVSTGGLGTLPYRCRYVPERGWFTPVQRIR